MTIADLATVILAIATTTSLIYISRQVNVTRLQTKGQFLLALDEQIREFMNIGLKLANIRQPFTPTPDDWREIVVYMGIYERINIMVEDKILDLPLVDRLYGVQLVAILANDSIYQMLQSGGSEWQDFIHLCKAVAAHRRQVSVASYDQAFIERAGKLTTDGISPGNLWSSLINS